MWFKPKRAKNLSKDQKLTFKIPPADYLLPRKEKLLKSNKNEKLKSSERITIRKPLF